MPRVPLAELQAELLRVLAHLGFAEHRARVIAQIFAEAQRDGVQSHGVNRFPGFVANVRAGRVVTHTDPVRVGGLGALEQWDGRSGAGPWNAHRAMQRAIDLTRTHGLGCVALRNTNHWMRAGAYGLQAADAGCVGICWTNTIPLMPPWGSADVKIGNNPLVIAVPRRGGHLLLDAAMSQFSNGKLELSKLRGRELPFAGGFDRDGQLTRDPAAILESRRHLPIGYWKGSALSIVLDAVAALLSGGLATGDLGRQGAEWNVSQIFLAFDARTAGTAGDAMLDALVAELHAAVPLDSAAPVRYPGEGMLQARRESLERGVWVDDPQWAGLKAM